MATLSVAQVTMSNGKMLNMTAIRPDTTVASSTTFSDLPVHRDVVRALTTMRFLRPSPIQLHALPVALFGNDVIGQAKSGTGKTAIFGVTAIEHAIRYIEKRRHKSEKVVVGDPLALILAPTREIAVQIETVLRQLAQCRPEIVIRTCIGGLAVSQDQIHLSTGCHIVVGTPGRVKALVDQCFLPCTSIRLLILDEVDKLMARDFENDIQYIANAIPERRQTLAFSATFTPDQLLSVASLMRTPQIIRTRGQDEVTTEFISCPEDLANWEKREQSTTPELWLRQVRQFYSIIEPLRSVSLESDPLDMKAKILKLSELLSEIVFNQCMVFCNDKFRAEALATALMKQGWPAACITGSQAQSTRLEVMEGFRESRSRVLVSTDLTARGIDVDKVNFVVNLDLPRDAATYLHRVGRSGRFGEKGLAVTLLSHSEVQGIHLLGRVFKMEISELPTPVPPGVYTYVAAEGDGDHDEVLQSGALVGPEKSPAKENNIKDSVDDVECNVDSVIGKQSAEQKVAADELALRARYEEEEEVYEQWLKLL